MELLPAVAVTVPPVQLPPTAEGVATTRPAGKESVKLKVWVGLPVGCVTVNVNVWTPPTVRAPANDLSTAGTAALTVTHAPVTLVPPPAALFATLAVAFVSDERLALPFVLLACGQVPTVGDGADVTSTVIVQLVAGLTIWRPATLIVPLPAVAVIDPPEQVPPTVDGEATTIPAGKVSVKLKVCVGLPLGCVTVNVSVCVPPTVSAPANALFTDGTACVTTRLADAVLPVNGPAADIAPETLLYVPIAVPFTGTLTTTVTVQVLFAGMVPPVRLTEVAPAVAVKVPAQVFEVVEGVATTICCGKAGKLSANATAVIAVLVPLPSVKVSVLG